MSAAPHRPSFPPTQRIGIFVFEGFEPLDVFGFAEAFTIARFLGTGYADPPPYPFAVTLIGRRVEPVRSANGPAVLPDRDMDQALAEPLDVLMIPGGGGTWPLLDDAADPEGVAALLDWVRRMDGKVTLMASVCTGAAVLARTGLLDGRPAATNHASFAWVAQQGPAALWDSVSRWVDAGRYVTSAGVSAGTDLGFYLVSRLAGRAVAENAAAAAEYDWHRDPHTPIAYPQRAAIVEIDREKDAEKRTTLIEKKRKDLQIDEKPQVDQERWNRNIDRVQQQHHDADQRHGVGASAKQADASLEAGRAAEHGKPTAAKVRVAKLDDGQAKTVKSATKQTLDDFGATATSPAKLAEAKPASSGPKLG